MAESLQRPRVLLVPGIGNSGPTHWQSLWETRYAGYLRVQQRDWAHPVCSEWRESLESAARREVSDVLIAAHSLGTLLVAHWLAATAITVAGALLVAVPDPEGQRFPMEALGFAPVPRVRLPCPTVVVASANDPYSELRFARACADAWGSRLVNVGQAGHINADSGLGDWDEGHRLLQALGTGTG
jgi:predicted alpha/beta hydrolase family esterase